MFGVEWIDEIEFKKRDFFISWGIYAFCFYIFLLIIFFIIFSVIQLLGEIPIIYLIIKFFVVFPVVYVIVINILQFQDAKLGKEKAIKDLVSPINDSDSYCNKILDRIDNLPKPYLKIINFFRRNIQIARTYGYLYWAYLVGREWFIACDNRELSSSENHDAIVVIVYNRFSSSAMFGCGIDLLIGCFNQNNRPYKIYLCDTREKFLSIINTPKAKRIWIFGHGKRGGVSCSDGLCLYEDLEKRMAPESKGKEAVYQFHCNSGNEKSLVELLSVKKGFVNHSSNDEFAIREYLTNIIRNNRFDELIMLN